MREFLDAILGVIGSETLTDDEFSTIEITETTYTEATYDALKAVLQAREDVSGQVKRLKLYFLARGVEFVKTQPTKVPKSNIFLGSEL